MALRRWNVPAQRVEIDLLDRRRSAALYDREPVRQRGCEGRPCGAKSLIDAARSPFPGALSNLVGCEKPGGLGARQFRLIRRKALVREPDLAGVFHRVTEMTMQPCPQRAVAGHIDERNRRIRWQRFDAVVGQHFMIAAE